MNKINIEWWLFRECKNNIWIKIDEIDKQNVSIKLNIIVEEFGKKYTNGIQILYRRYAENIQEGFKWGVD